MTFKSSIVQISVLLLYKCIYNFQTNHFVEKTGSQKHFFDDFYCSIVGKTIPHYLPCTFVSQLETVQFAIKL